MPGPPPPPQPPMAPPAPPPSHSSVFSLPKSNSGGEDDRGALLKSIRQGKKLKKTVTVDKSAPIIPGKSNNNISAPTLNGGPSQQLPHNPPSLGGLFAGGMPKLKSTGRLGTSILKTSPNCNNNVNNNENNNSNSCTVDSPISKHFLSVQDQLKKQLNNSSNSEIIKNRGPPPPAPIRNLSLEESNKNSKQETNSSISSTSLVVSNSDSGQIKNNSALHRKSKSNANLSNYLDLKDTNSTSPTITNNNNSKPGINHGKPNLAPKPPILNGKPITISAPGGSKLSEFKANKMIYRAQSMRNPRTPSPSSSSLSPQNCSQLSLNDVAASSTATIKFGTVRNVSQLIGQSLSNLSISSSNSSNASSIQVRMGGSHVIHTRSGSRPQLATRPTVPPPGPPSNNNNHSSNKMKPPNHAPPPPPPQPAGSVPPPPPPHKTQLVGSSPSYSRPSPGVPNSNQHLPPPPPPPRNSSMRAATVPAAVDFDEKFKYLFVTPDKFPRPPLYRNVLKVYSNRQGNKFTAVKTNKQQAPLPPSLASQFHQSTNSAIWNLPTTTY